MSLPNPPRDLHQPALSRRTVFAGAGAAGATVAAAAVLPGMLQKPISSVATASFSASSGGYQLTEHVQRYYETAKV
ncbi:hypothetical protein B2J86_07465 [Acidovorax sp. SRB_14]|nr:hypothetical protein [Acidovorax sp. SRB_14]